MTEGSLLSHLGHALAEPVVIARGRAELAAAGGPDGPEHAREALDAVRRVAHVLEGIARLDNAGREPQPQDVALAEVLHTAVAGVRARAEDDRPAPQVAVGHLPRAHVDPVLLRAALEELVDNAGVHGGGACRVTCEELPDGLVLRVADRGPGISADRLDAARTPFRRLARSGPRHVGAGLAVADAAAAAHGGTLRLATPATGGLVAELALPAACRVHPSGDEGSSPEPALPMT